MKRMTDVAIWDKPWFYALAPVEKCAIRYLFDRCDNVGVWEPNFQLAEVYIGAPVDWDNLVKKCNRNVVILENGKWWIRDFCMFQYGELLEDTKNKAHLSYINLLKKHKLWGTYGAPVPHGNGTDAIKDKDKEKDKDTDKGKEKDKEKDLSQVGVVDNSKDPDARVKHLIDYYHEKYLARTKKKPSVTGMWGKQFKMLLHNNDEDAIKRVIDYFFGYEKRTDFAFGTFLSRFDALAPGALNTIPKSVDVLQKAWTCKACGYKNSGTGQMCIKCKVFRE